MTPGAMIVLPVVLFLVGRGLSRDFRKIGLAALSKCRECLATEEHPCRPAERANLQA
jgi:hypothetical protein